MDISTITKFKNKSYYSSTSLSYDEYKCLTTIVRCKFDLEDH